MCCRLCRMRYNWRPVTIGGRRAINAVIREAGKTVDIPLIDHVIVGVVSADPQKRGYYSFREHELI